MSLFNISKKRRCTLLGVGPMSNNCINATSDISLEHSIPLMLIASRRQIDCSKFGGGYVNNWSTDQYSKYIKSKKNNFLYMARDHGGPWQNDSEFRDKLPFTEAMKRAKKSFESDIDADFKIIHIDPSVDPHKKLSSNEILNRVYELYEHCWLYAQRRGKKIFFEIGTEEQSGSTNTFEEVEYTISELTKFCINQKLPKPKFIVLQTGTKVLETRNVGSFDSPLRIKNEIASEILIPYMINICDKYNIILKQHNTDYLSDDSLSWMPKLGIGAANVAPEFGVAETTALLKIAKKYSLLSYREQFIEKSYNSHKWKKWMIPNSSASDFDKAIIAGHYVFSDPDIIELKNKISVELKNFNIDLNDYLKAQIRKSILRYVKCFNLID